MLQVHLAHLAQVPVLGPVIFLSSPGFFNWKMVIFIKVWTLSVPTATQMFSADRAKKQIFTYYPLNIHIFINISVYPSISLS
jgi:hypothetical protein